MISDERAPPGKVPVGVGSLRRCVAKASIDAPIRDASASRASCTSVPNTICSEASTPSAAARARSGATRESVSA